MKNTDVICIGSAVLDITAFPVADQKKWKEKQRISNIRTDIGGDAANQAVRLTDLGLRAGLFTLTGDDPNGQIMKSLLEKRGVLMEYMSVRKNSATGTALVLVNKEGERHTFSVEGAHSTLSMPDIGILLENDGAFFDQNKVKALTIASIFSMPFLEGRGLFELVQEAQKHGVLTFADLASDKLKQGMPGVRRLLPFIDWFMPSMYDAAEMTGEESPERAAEAYRSAGAKNVVIKLGEKGCYYCTDHDSGFIPAPKVNPVDTTGAGDCMNAVFLSRILKGEDVRTALSKACLGASLSTEAHGATGGRILEKDLLPVL